MLSKCLTFQGKTRFFNLICMCFNLSLNSRLGVLLLVFLTLTISATPDPSDPAVAADPFRYCIVQIFQLKILKS